MTEIVTFIKESFEEFAPVAVEVIEDKVEESAEEFGWGGEEISSLEFLLLPGAPIRWTIDEFVKQKDPPGIGLGGLLVAAGAAYFMLR